MPRANRCVLAGTAYHITQRGVDRRETFSSEADRTTYLSLLAGNRVDANVRILAWCLMPNHVHLVAIPEREDSLAVMLRRTQGRYAQYYNTRHNRLGHLWQNRYYCCALDLSHLWLALAYVDRNPVRAGLVERAQEYRWSSAAAHLGAEDLTGLLDREWWARQALGGVWPTVLQEGKPLKSDDLRRCTYAGRPFGDERFVTQMAEHFGRRWAPPAPKARAADAISAGA